MKQKKTYRTPQTLELGSLFHLTRGPGSSDKWDIGSGYKESCSGSSGGGTGPLNPC